MSPAGRAPDEEPASAPESRLLLAAGVMLHGLMAIAALTWLWLRDRTEALPERAIGSHGPWLASGTGLLTGLLGAMVLAAVSPRFARLRDVEALARRSFAPVGDAAIVLFVTVGAIAEELFFRLAVQDALGLAGSVAVCVAVNSSIAGWVWLPIAAGHALVLGLLVQQGFGLLGATTANAVMNYFHLRRIQCSTGTPS
jgi:hypothetical protein